MADKRTGGPRTPEGKARSSQNATKHGVLSNGLILPGESQAEYDSVERGWREQFAPADFQEERLVEILIRNDWMFRRAERVFLGAQEEPWTPEGHHRLELLQRYRTAAERSFYRAWNALRGLRRDLDRLETQKSMLRIKTQEGELEAEAVSFEKNDSEGKPAEILRVYAIGGHSQRTPGRHANSRVDAASSHKLKAHSFDGPLIRRI